MVRNRTDFLIYLSVLKQQQQQQQQQQQLLELRELPASLNRCPLRTLSASDNPLLELIPAELFVGMTTLGSLKLQQTRIDVLPATLCEAIALVELLVDCDLMYYPPSDICRRGPRAMLEYCADSDNVQPALAVVESDNDSMRRRQGGSVIFSFVKFVNSHAFYRESVFTNYCGVVCNRAKVDQRSAISSREYCSVACQLEASMHSRHPLPMLIQLPL
jgi:hypothetical protein